MLCRVGLDKFIMKVSVSYSSMVILLILGFNVTFFSFCFFSFFFSLPLWNTVSRPLFSLFCSSTKYFSLCDEPRKVLIYSVWNSFLFHITSTLDVLTLYSKLPFLEGRSQKRNFFTLCTLSSVKIIEVYLIKITYLPKIHYKIYI